MDLRLDTKFCLETILQGYVIESIWIRRVAKQVRSEKMNGSWIHILPFLSDCETHALFEDLPEKLLQARRGALQKGLQKIFPRIFTNSDDASDSMGKIKAL